MQASSGHYEQVKYMNWVHCCRWLSNRAPMQCGPNCTLQNLHTPAALRRMRGTDQQVATHFTLTVNPSSQCLQSCSVCLAPISRKGALGHVRAGSSWGSGYQIQGTGLSLYFERNATRWKGQARMLADACVRSLALHGVCTTKVLVQFASAEVGWHMGLQGRSMTRLSDLPQTTPCSRHSTHQAPPDQQHAVQFPSVVHGISGQNHSKVFNGSPTFSLGGMGTPPVTCGC